MQTLLRRVDPARPRAVVVTAVVVGVLAGLTAAVFLSVAGEPAIEDAIALEEAAADPAAADHEEALVSREVQRGVGLFGAYALTGAGFGFLFSMAFLGFGRGRPDLFRRSLLAAAVLGGAITVAPWLKYPPNPPAVGDPATLDDRQRLYLGLIVLSLVLLVGAVHLSTRLRAAAWSEPQRVAVVTLALLGAALLLLAALPPAPDEIGVPAALLWRFRLASLGGNALFWTVLGVGFGVLATAAERHRLGRAT